jgi:hypothetical protein
MALQKYFSCPSVVNYFFQTPPKKLKLGLQVSGRFLIANTWFNQKEEEAIGSYLLRSSLARCYALLCHLTPSANSAKI